MNDGDIVTKCSHPRQLAGNHGLAFQSFRVWSCVVMQNFLNANA